jgi:geranylgeranyl pyrophosphate synthase
MIPIFSEKDSSTRDKIVSVLAAYPGISTKKISAILKKQYALNVTYQAIHKTLKQMVEQGILTSKKREYYLSGDWIQNLKLFLDKVTEKKVSEKSTLKYNKISDELETVEIETLEEAEKQFMRFRDEYFDNIHNYNESERIICMQSPRLIIALMSPTKEYEFMEKLYKNKTKHYTLCSGDTEVDRWIAKFYNRQKERSYIMKTGADCSSILEVWVYPDKLVECFFPGRFWKALDNLYREIKKIEDINYNTIIETYNTNLQGEKIKFVIHRDPSLVKLAREETLKQFGIYTDDKDKLDNIPQKTRLKSLNQKRFEEMKETYNEYISKYKKFVVDLVKENDPKIATLFIDYVVSRIGSKYGIRPYILRKFMDINNINWKNHIDLLSYVELHLASMYCFNAGADRKTTFDIDKKYFFKCRDILRQKVFDSVQKDYGKDILEIFKDSDTKFYTGQVFDTLINTKEYYTLSKNAVISKLKKEYSYEDLGIEYGIIEKTLKKYKYLENPNKLFVYERTYGINSALIENFAKIIDVLSDKTYSRNKKYMFNYGKYCGLSNMIVNDIQDFSLDFVKEKFSTREKERTDVFADLKNGYITWVISYALTSNDKLLKKQVLDILGKRDAKYLDQSNLRKAFIESGIFKKAICDAVAYAFLGINELEQVINIDNIEDINLLKDLIMTTAKCSKYVKFMEKEYKTKISLTQAEYKKIKKFVLTNQSKSLNLLRERKFADKILG